MAAPGPLLPAGVRFDPSDEILLRHFSDQRTGFGRLSGMISSVPNLYVLNQALMPRLGEGERREFEDDGIETIISTWLVLSTKFVAAEDVNQVRGGYWKGENMTYVIDRNLNRPIGFNRVVCFYEGDESRSFWTATEVIAPYASATTVVCRLTKMEILPSFGMVKRYATLSLEELMDEVDL